MAAAARQGAWSTVHRVRREGQSSLEAVKALGEPSAWEFYISQKLQARERARALWTVARAPTRRVAAFRTHCIATSPPIPCRRRKLRCARPRPRALV